SALARRLYNFHETVPFVCDLVHFSRGFFCCLRRGGPGGEGGRCFKGYPMAPSPYSSRPPPPPPAAAPSRDAPRRSPPKPPAGALTARRLAAGRASRIHRGGR